MQRPHTRFGAGHIRRFKKVVISSQAAPVSCQRHAHQEGLSHAGSRQRVRMEAALATNPNHLFVERMQQARQCG